MSYITTYTGNHFDPINPDPELINIVDIAHALPMICRGTVRSVRSVGGRTLHSVRERSRCRRIQQSCDRGCTFA